jgi:hypothetical protein
MEEPSDLSSMYSSANTPAKLNKPRLGRIFSRKIMTRTKRIYMLDAEDQGKDIYREVKGSTEYVIDRSSQGEDGKESTTWDISMDVDEEKSTAEDGSRIETHRIRGFHRCPLSRQEV